MSDDYEINITPNAISVLTRKVRRVVDQDTGETLEIPELPHRRALGLGDFDGDAKAFQSAVAALIQPVLGRDASAAVARATAAEADRAVAVADKAAAVADRDAAVAELEKLRSDRAAEPLPADVIDEIR